MTDFLVRRAGLVSLLVLAALLLATLTRPFVRDMNAPVELRFAPRDASTVVMVPDPDALAARLHVHLCPFLEDPAQACYFRPVNLPEAGPLARLFESANDIRDGTLALFTPIAKLQELGIDTSKPILFAARGPLTSTDFIIVASLRPDDSACTQLTGFLESDFAFDLGGDAQMACAQNKDARANGVDETRLSNANLFYKRLGGQNIAFYTNQDSFDIAWKNKHKPAQLLAQDNFRSAFKEITLRGDPSLWAYSRQTGLAVLSPLALAITFDPAPADQTLPLEELETARAAFVHTFDESGVTLVPPDFMEGSGAMRLTVWSAPAALYSRAIDSFLSDIPSGKIAFSDLGYGASLTLAAEDMMQYMRFASFGASRPLPDVLFAGPDAILPDLTRYGTIVRNAEKLTTIDAVNLQLAGFQDRIPDLVFRFAISSEEADELVRTIQMEEQTSRDIAVLRGAEPARDATFWTPDCTDGDGVARVRTAISDMASARKIDVAGTPGSFSHLWCTEPQSWFKGPQYEGCFNGEDPGQCTRRNAYAYLQPPLNEDDFTYRFGSSFESGAIESDKADARNQLINNNRFRLVSTFDPEKEQLWIASDASALERILSRDGEYRLAENRADLLLMPDRLHALISAQQFDSAEQDVLPDISLLFEELSVYREVRMQLQIMEDQRGVRFDVAFTR
ncbi:MAG: hypothetical protein V7741_01480 [Hyphomonas sp.]